MKPFWIIIPVILALASCATKKVNPATATRVQGTTTPEPGKERITFLRDSGAMGSACAMTVTVDNMEVGRLKPGQRVDAYVEPGDHVVEVSTGGGLCGRGQASANCALTLGSPKAFRVGYPSGNAFDGATLAIMPVAP